MLRSVTFQIAILIIVLKCIVDSAKQDIYYHRVDAMIVLIKTHYVPHAMGLLLVLGV